MPTNNFISRGIKILNLSSVLDCELSLSAVDNVVYVVEKAKLLEVDLGLKRCSRLLSCRILGKSVSSAVQ